MRRFSFLAVFIVIVTTWQGAAQSTLSYPSRISCHNPAPGLQQEAQDEQPFNPLLEKAAQREKRLRAYMMVVIDRVQHVCELDQRQHVELEQRLEPVIKKVQEEWFGGELDRARNIQLKRDAMPFVFASRGAAAHLLQHADWQQALDEILTESQLQRLQSAMQRRARHQKQSIAEGWVASLDHKLYLTPGQRPPLTQHLLDGVADDLLVGVFVVTPGRFMHQPVQISSHLGSQPIADVFNSAQQQRLEQLVVQRNSDTAGKTVWFKSIESRDQWNDVLRKALQDQTRRLVNLMYVRIQLMSQQLDLDAKQVRRLEILAKGVVKRNLEKWENKINVELDRYDRMPRNGNGKFGLQSPKTLSLFHSRQWKKGVDQATTDGGKKRLDELTKDRREYWRSATAKYLAAMIDLELWLTEDQRNSLEICIRDVLPSHLEWDANELREFRLLFHVLTKIPQPKLAELLSDHQRNAWQQLQAQYEVTDNQVEITFDNGGAMWTIQR